MPWMVPDTLEPGGPMPASPADGNAIERASMGLVRAMLVVSLLLPAQAVAGVAPTCAAFLDRAVLAGHWDLATGTWNEAAVGKLERRGKVAVRREGDTVRWSFDGRDDIRALTLRSDALNGDLLAVEGEVHARLGRDRAVLSCRGDEVTIALGPPAAFHKDGLWRATGREGLYLHDDHALAWVRDARFWEATGATFLGPLTRALDDAWNHRDVAELEAALVSVHDGADAVELLLLPRVHEALEVLKDAGWGGDDLLPELELAAMAQLVRAGVGQPGTELWRSERYVTIQGRARDAAKALAWGEAASGRLGSAAYVEALREALDREVLRHAADARPLGEGWDDPETRRLHTLLLQAAARVVPALDPRVGLTHELDLFPGYGTARGMAFFGARLGPGYGAWVEGQGLPIVTPTVGWDDALVHHREVQQGSCTEIRRPLDAGRHQAWADRVTQAQQALWQDREAPRWGVENDGSPRGGRPLEAVRAGPWLQGLARWTEGGMVGAVHGPLRWAAVDGLDGQRAALTALLLREPALGEREEAHEASFQRVVDRWAGTLVRRVQIDGVGEFTSEAAVDARRDYLDGPRCVGRIDTLATREVIREQVAIARFDAEILTSFREIIGWNIASLTAPTWSKGETAREREALRWLFQEPVAERTWTTVPFREEALAVGAFGDTVAVAVPQGLVRYRRGDGARIGLTDLSAALLDDFEIEAAAFSVDGSLLAVRLPVGIRVLRLLPDAELPAHVASLGLVRAGELVFLDGATLAFQRRSGASLAWQVWDLETGDHGPPTRPLAYRLSNGITVGYTLQDAPDRAVLTATVLVPGELGRRYVQPRGVTEAGIVYYSGEVARAGSGRVLVADPHPEVPPVVAAEPPDVNEADR